MPSFSMTRRLGWLMAAVMATMSGACSFDQA
jgi:hypothetical protein